MEGSDAFGHAVEISEEDPFAGTDFGDFGETANSTPPVQPEGAEVSRSEPSGELKTVDKEGRDVSLPQHVPADAASVESQTGEAAQPVTEGQTPAVQTELRALGEQAMTDEQRRRDEEARQYREERGEPHPRAFDHNPAGPGPTHMLAGAERPHSDQARLRAIAEREAEEKRRAEEGDAPLTEDPTTPGSLATGPSVPSSPADSSGEAESGDPTPASSGEQGATGEPESGSDDEDAPPPVEPQDSSGKTTKRRYVVLKVVGSGKFEQVTWYEDANGKMVPKGPGTKRQGIALARGAEDALKTGYVAVGAPQDGVHLVAVAQLHFQPKRIKPKAPEPSAVRLEIS